MANLHDLQRTVLLAPLLDQVNCGVSRLMKEALTIVVVHISRQQGQSLLHVGQDLSLKAGADFLQRVNEPGHFVRPDPPVQARTIEPGHFSPHPASVPRRSRERPRLRPLKPVRAPLERRTNRPRPAPTSSAGNLPDTLRPHATTLSISLHARVRARVGE